MSLELVGILNERAGCGLEVVGVTDQGQSGAAFVRWPDGRSSVVTTAFADLERMQQTATVLAAARGLGIPVPRHECLVDLGDGRVAVVQERMPGRTVTEPEPEHIDAMVLMNDRFTHLLADRPDVPAPRLNLGRPDDPTPTEEIEQHGPRARRVLQAIRATAGDREADVIGDDLVHVDLTVANMLFDDGDELAGVIDWNYGVARGDRNYGLVKLLHNLSFDAATGGATGTPLVTRVEQIVAERVETQTLRRYWAHHTLNMMYASLRWGTQEAFAGYLELGESRLT